MPIRILSDGRVEGVKTKKVPAKRKKNKKERKESIGVQRGPKGCPYATLIGKASMGNCLYECSMWLDCEKQCVVALGDCCQLDVLKATRLGEGAELCIDCDRKPHIVEYKY